ncbi:copper chaperone PCu(A)C [Nocardioides jensenii]|uniref:hypothetical protein n=1 Tax=Nocardioides jensenii TaxID=1843 RepID=UPI0012FC9A78|nr:hypothetical protein [Nocardioides jensenii]
MMLRNRIARAIAAGTLVLTAPLLSSCGFNYATDKVYTPAPGANDRDAEVDVLNAVIVATEDGKGTLVTTLSNNSLDDADRLTAVSGKVVSTSDDDGEGGPVEAKVKPVDIEPGSYTRIATASDTLGKGEAALVPGIVVTGPFKLGGWVELTLTFKTSDPVTVQVPVVENNGQWAGQDGDTLTPVDPALTHHSGSDEGEGEGH